MKKILLSCIALFITALFANTAPVVSNLRASQRSGAYLIDIYYNLYDADADQCYVSLQASDDGGVTWNVSCTLTSGNIGANQTPGNNKHIIWDAGSEYPNTVKDYHFKVTAYDSQSPIAGFVYVPGGTFTMGRTKGEGWDDELPTHSVTLNSFYMGKYLVTQGEYQAVMGSNPASGYGVGANYPVYNVSWYSAIKYCNLRSMNEGLMPVYSISGSTNPANWGSVPTSDNSTWNAAVCNWTANGYRLPTEAEWEYAARGATNNPDYLYSGSDDVNTVAWYSGNNSPSGSKPVGTKAPNGLGIYDMSGNLWEWCWDWCWDWWNSSYYSSSPANNPTGPGSGSYRVQRGGGWYDVAAGCRVACRDDSYPSYANYDVGLRLCRAGL